MVNNDKQLEIVYDHYKDTWTKIESCCKLRDKIFLYILFALSPRVFGVIFKLRSRKYFIPVDC